MMSVEQAMPCYHFYSECRYLIPDTWNLYNERTGLEPGD
jgi:hypothetical protein